ncbi:MAG: Wzz/FepE/Etk N-terminal domain-containing protein [Bacteroidetes bacterium]|nr:Wzz/FepE/Etk N-terminal domain-containing protein [Bacteroidota bacterium]MDA1120838.1 Wzz/FepE/Etk N-terminal domain-containing protein [Bacteroidota bacterium]
MKKNQKSIKEIFSGEEIVLSDIFKLFYERRKYLYITVALFSVMGLLVAITSPVEYSSKAKVLSENSGGANSSSLSSLAVMAQLQSGAPLLNNQSQQLGAEMYPQIVSSQPFLKQLMQEKFYFQEKGMELTLFEYFSQERPGHIFSKLFNILRSLPGRFFSLFDQEKTWEIPEALDGVESENTESLKKWLSIENVSSTERYVMSELASRITIGGEGRILELSVKMPEPLISAQLNLIIFEKIIDYVVAYQTDKQRENLKYVQERCDEAEDKFKLVQLRLANFRDSNQGNMTSKTRTIEEQLQAEFNLTFNVYNGLAQQLEQLKIQLKKDTPLFSEFEPVSIPLNKAEPSIPGILTKYVILGVVFGGLLIFFLTIRSDIKRTHVVSDVNHELD